MIESVGVIGVVEPDRARAAQKVTKGRASTAHARGKLDLSTRETLPGRLRWVSAIADLPAELDLAVEAVPPVWSMPLVEIVRGKQTDAEAVAAAQRAVAQIGKEPIVVADAPGFATSRLGVSIGLGAMRMLEDGVASADDIDRAMELGYRPPMGPLRLTDLIGLDVRLDIATNLTKAYGPRFDPPADSARQGGRR